MENRNKSILLWVLIILGLGAIVLAIVGVVTQEPKGTISTQITATDWVKGPKNAKAQLIEYSDFQCPACKYYYIMVKQLENEFPDQLKVVFRNFPLTQIHKNAVLASQSAEAAGKQGKFWEMHDVLFERQEEWSESDDALNHFTSYAKNLNLDLNKFLTDIGSEEIVDKVQQDIMDGQSTGIVGTPTFFINGKQIQNPETYEQFKQIILDGIVK